MANDHEGKWARLCKSVDALIKKRDVPGVAVGVLYKGVTATAGFGVTNVDHPLSVTDETLFQIGSITKTFTGTAIMRLVEMGKLDLDATVRTYVPSFKVADEMAASQATIFHLLTHTGGWAGDFFDDNSAGDDASSKYVANMADLEQLAPIGTVFSYNNSGFYLAGHIIEVVTGKSYQAALRELVLEPLGLKHCYLDAGDVMTHRFAVGHENADEGAKVARPWPLPRAAYAAGGLVCDVKDLLRYARFHLGDGKTEDDTQLLSSESLSRMHTPRVTVWGGSAWGLTWATDEIGETRQLSHGGGTVGQVSFLRLIPEHDFAIAILTNADRGGAVTGEVGRWALKEYLGLEVPEPKPIESSEAELAPYVGRYRRPFGDVELGILGGKLIAQYTPKGGFPTQDVPPPPAPPPMSLARCEEDRLLALDGHAKGTLLDIIRKPEGAIGWLRMGARIHIREA
ncbi:MAG: serine hydrolase [Candidatus Poribacteria bacterium]|nr:serine hydrolase [Candidatus Poribacteria bacterium]